VECQLHRPPNIRSKRLCDTLPGNFTVGDALIA
jgi:hypothetical protein